jgi:hypothetical protein
VGDNPRSPTRNDRTTRGIRLIDAIDWRYERFTLKPSARARQSQLSEPSRRRLLSAIDTDCGLAKWDVESALLVDRSKALGPVFAVINDVDNVFDGLVPLARSRERGAVDQRTNVSRPVLRDTCYPRYVGGKRRMRWEPNGNLIPSTA